MELRRAIEQRQLLPGEPLRLEPLSRRLKLSVQPIREAIRLLEVEGSAVAKVPLADIIDLCVMRTSIEPTVMSLATQRASDEELVAIRRAHTESKALDHDGNATEDLIQMPIDWHLIIYAAARSRQLSNFIDQVWTAIRINSAWEDHSQRNSSRSMKPSSSRWKGVIIGLRPPRCTGTFARASRGTSRVSPGRATWVWRTRCTTTNSFWMT